MNLKTDAINKVADHPLVKYPYTNGVSWAFLRIMDIPDAHCPELVYLRRFIIFKTPLVGLYVHAIYRADSGRWPHNHPMNFVSLVLLGGYREVIRRVCKSPAINAIFRMRGDETKTHRAGSIHLMRRVVWSKISGETQLFHRIAILFRVPTYTLVLTLRRFDDWGYSKDNGEYVSAKVHHGGTQ